MARPRTPIGTFGEIDFRTNPSGSVRARTRFRDDDGQLRPVEATGPNPKAAERNLKEKIARRGHYATGIGELSPDTTFAKLVEVWLEDLDLEDRIAASTRELYERDMRTLVMPTFERYTLRGHGPGTSTGPKAQRGSDGHSVKQIDGSRSHPTEGERHDHTH